MKAIEMIYLWAQVIVSLYVVLAGAAYAIRCIIERCDIIIVALFAAIAYVGYKFMLANSLAELRKALKAHRHGSRH